MLGPAIESHVPLTHREQQGARGSLGTLGLARQEAEQGATVMACWGSRLVRNKAAHICQGGQALSLQDLGSREPIWEPLCI